MIIISGAAGGIGEKLLQKISKLDNVLALYNKKEPLKKIAKVNYVQINLNKEKEIYKLNKFIKDKSKIVFLSLAAVKIDSLLINQNSLDFDKIINTNLKSNFLISKYLLKKMIYSNWGRLIFFSSTGSVRGDVGTSVYSASKLGLLGLSKVISKEYGMHNITSNIIELGAFNEGMYKKLNLNEKKKIIDKIPKKKLGKISHIYNTIRFLINTEFCNGSIIKLDGGAD